MEAKVRRLLLAGARPPPGWGARAWVADALACAALPAAWRGRYVLLRRLRVGAASVARLADALQAAWAELRLRPGLPAQGELSAEIDEDERVDGLWFDDEAAARLALACRSRQDCGAGRPWWGASLLGPEAWSQWQALAAAPRAQRLQWLAELPWQQRPLPAVRREALRQALSCLAEGGEPAQALAVLAMPLRSEAGALFSDSPPRHAGEAGPSAAPDGVPRRRSSRGALPASPSTGPDGPGPRWHRAADGDPGRAARSNTPASPLRAAASPDEAMPAPAMPMAEPQATLAAALPLVLNLWQALPPAGAEEAWHWLRELAIWLRLPPEDPWWSLLPAVEPAPAPLPLRALRRLALQQTRLPLRRLLRQPGLLLAGPTHWELELPMHSVRLAVRRAGLDLDPGWQALLGRVVRLHYA